MNELAYPGLVSALAVSPIWAAGIGMLWPVGRMMYALGYYRAPEKRTVGLLVSMPPIYIFVLGSIVGFSTMLF